MLETEYAVAEAVIEKALASLGQKRGDLIKRQLTPKVFGDVITTSLRTMHPDRRFHREADLVVVLESADKAKFSDNRLTLDRLINTFENGDEEEIWHRLVSILLELSATVEAFADPASMFELSRDRLVPLLKLRSQVDQWNSESPKLPGMPAGKVNGFLHWPVTGDVVMTVALDTKDNYAFMTGEHLRFHDVSEDAARETALANLRKMLEKAKPRTNYRKEIVEISGVGGLASSLILLDDFWQKEAIKAKDGLLIIAREWDSLVVARIGDRDTCRMLGLACVTRRIATIFTGAVFVYDAKGMRQATPSDLIA